jgi:hypothetical protein
MFGAGEVRCHAPGRAGLRPWTSASPTRRASRSSGADLDALLITTARHELSPTSSRSIPDAGRLFLADVGSSGEAMRSTSSTPTGVPAPRGLGTRRG